MASSDTERRLRGCWELLKEELRAEDFVYRFIDMGLLTEEQKEAILNPTQTESEKSEQFLQAVVAGGSRTYQNLCNILLERNDPKYQGVAEALDIVRRDPDGGANGYPSNPLSARTNYSDSEMNTSIRLESARQVWRSEPMPRHDTDLEPEKPDTLSESRSATPSTDEMVQRAVEKATRMPLGATCGDDSRSLGVDMESLEKELLTIAPTIADLFQKISKQTKNMKATDGDELDRIKEDNERLRKTNKALIEKLNTFQGKIIQLQLENKKLKDYGDNAKIEQEKLEKRSSELDGLKDKLVEQKIALENKERELDLQIQKINGIVKENENQKQMIQKLEVMHEEGLLEFEIQQDQISELMEEKERQREQIEELEEKHKMSEQLFHRLEERLLMLERGGDSNRRNRQRQQYISRMGKTPWTGAGTYERSHHASVKFPDSIVKGKGWAV